MLENDFEAMIASPLSGAHAGFSLGTHRSLIVSSQPRTEIRLALYAAGRTRSIVPKIEMNPLQDSDQKESPTELAELGAAGR